MTWGITADGQKFSSTQRVAAPPAASPAPAAALSPSGAQAGTCSLYISNTWLNRTATFENETSQTGSGFYGAAYQLYQVWRSSWSGPRGYSAWGNSATTTAPYQDIYWNTRCHWGGGTYDYYGVIQGYASQLGWGPQVMAENTLRKPCGDTA